MNRSKYHLIELSERYCTETNRNEEKRILLISFILILFSIKFTNFYRNSQIENSITCSVRSIKDFSICFFHFLFSRILPCRANLLPSHGARIKRTRKRGSMCLVVLEDALDEWEEGGDAERGRIPEEEYAFAIPTTDFARGLGCGRSLDNARRKRRYEREEARFFSRSMPKGETSSPSVPGRRCTIEHQVADISGINFFERKNSFPFFLFLFFSRDFTW